MKKLSTAILVCILACSFMVGAVVTDVQAMPKVPDNCVPSKAPSICDPETCKSYDPYICNGKLRYIWTGDYCC